MNARARQSDQAASSLAPALPAINDIRLLAVGTSDLVGRSVALRNVRVLSMAETHGFYLDAPAGAVYVQPSLTMMPEPVVAPGDTISVSGTVAKSQPPRPGEINPPRGLNRLIHVVATLVTK